MALLQQPIQRKLSALLGADVTFEKLNLSLLGGSIEAVGVTVSAGAGLPPVLTMARVRAQVAVARALKGEIVVTSLTVERPAVTVVRRADGTTNLPKRMRAEGDESPAAPPPPAPEEEADDRSRWKFDVGKVLLVDGQATLTDEAFAGGRYEWAAAPILAELNRSGNGYGVTLIADHVRRPDTGAVVGTVRLTGMLEGAADLTMLAAASLRATVEVGELLQAKVASPALKSKTVELTAHGAVDAPRLVALLPPRALSPVIGGLSGRVQVDFAARIDAGNAVRVSELNLRATDVGIKPSW